jgi:hypothetical protein
MMCSYLNSVMARRSKSINNNNAPGGDIIGICGGSKMKDTLASGWSGRACVEEVYLTVNCVGVSVVNQSGGITCVLTRSMTIG